jgi:hypothetical protein
MKKKMDVKTVQTFTCPGRACGASRLSVVTRGISVIADLKIMAGTKSPTGAQTSTIAKTMTGAKTR